jgi:hypothetical protein
MRLRNFVILWLVVAVALFVLIPDSMAVAQFVWDAYIAKPEPEYVEFEGAVVLTGYALIVGPTAYVPYVWIAVGVVALVVYLVRARRAGA